MARSLGRFQGQSLRLAVGAEEGFLLLQHYSHQCHLDNHDPEKKKACQNKGAIVTYFHKRENYQLTLDVGFSAKSPRVSQGICSRKTPPQEVSPGKVPLAYA